MPKDLPEFSPEHYLNRELSWLEFNARVLEEAADPTNPCAGADQVPVDRQLQPGRVLRDPGGRAAGAALRRAGASGLSGRWAGSRRAAGRASTSGCTVWSTSSTGSCTRELIGEIFTTDGIEWVRLPELSPAERDLRRRALSRAASIRCSRRWRSIPGHPFPHVHNKSLNIALLVERTHANQLQELFAVVQVPGGARPGRDPARVPRSESASSCWRT